MLQNIFQCILQCSHNFHYFLQGVLNNSQIVYIYQNKQKMNFKDFKSLEAIERILNEASKTLKNKSITINNNKISN